MTVDTQQQWPRQRQEESSESPPPPRFGHVEEFVSEFLSIAIQRKQNSLRSVWCPKWWAHPEAVLRLTALHDAFEALRLQGGTGMSIWWVGHADPQLAVLFNRENGPFMFCVGGHTDVDCPLEHATPPVGWWDVWKIDAEVEAMERAHPALQETPPHQENGAPS